MNSDRDRDEESLADLWLTNWEQQCIQHLESEPDYEGQLHNDRDSATQKSWSCFQNTATSIAQLYKDRLQDTSSLWLPFQAAAGTVATLYKESTDAIRRSGDLGIQCGYQRRNKELLSWARKKRRNICREDLISYLAGKPLPPKSHSTHHRTSPRPRITIAHTGHSLQSTAAYSDFHHLAGSQGSTDALDANFHMFREALAYPGASRRPRSADLSAFVTGEYVRHCQAVKRPLPSPPPHDVNMDSPTHTKRPRFM